MDEYYKDEHLQALRVQGNVYVACAALWLYEYACMFHLEVEFIWKARWTVTKVAYLGTRYLQFVLVGALLHQSGSPIVLSRNDCIHTERLIVVMILVCMCLAEIIFTIRTWAVWGSTRKSGILLTCFFLSIWVPGFILVGLWLPLIAPSPLPVPTQIVASGCVNFIKSPLRLVNYGLMVPFYVVTVCLMAIQAYKSFLGRTSFSRFLRLVYLDGILYYVYLLCLSICNIIIIYTLPPQYADFLTVLQEFLASILACRMMLNLRAHDRPIVGLSEDLSSLKAKQRHHDTLFFRSTSIMDME